MSAKIVPTPGEVFGMWTVIEECPRPTHLKHKSTYVRAVCKCGAEAVLLFRHLRKGNTKSCRMCALGKHGLTKTSEWKAWDSMLQRCYNPNNSNYPNYGGRGITVCDRWNPKKGGSFSNFLADVGFKPDKTYQLDKEAFNKNSDHYGPDTTSWVTCKDNSSRKRTNVLIEYEGVELTLAEAARKYSMSETCLRYRLKAGWTTESALTTPPDRQNPVLKPTSRYYKKK